MDIVATDTITATDEAWPFYRLTSTTIPEESAYPVIRFVDHRNFPKIVGELVRNNADFDGVIYGAAHPKEELTVPRIAYRLIRRTPGIEDVETLKSRQRFVYDNANGTRTEIWSQWMTCLFQWDCYAHTGHEADELVDKLDRLLKANVGTFLDMGANNLIFTEQLIDTLLARSSDVPCRSLQWTAYLENYDVRHEDVIRQIALRALQPQVELYESVQRGYGLLEVDELEQTYISKILCVSNPSTSGIARQEDYLPGIDFEILYDPITQKTSLMWLEPGARPQPGSTYYVRYLYWSGFSTLLIPR